MRRFGSGQTEKMQKMGTHQVDAVWGEWTLIPVVSTFLINREEGYLAVMSRGCWKVQSVGRVSRILRRAREKCTNENILNFWAA